MDRLPWVDSFLNIVKREYQQSPPSYHLTEPSYADLHYIEKVATEADSFDVLGLKRQTWLAYQQGQARILKCQSDLGSILLLTFKNNPLTPTWNTWWRAVRLLSPKNQSVYLSLPIRNKGCCQRLQRRLALSISMVAQLCHVIHRVL